MASKSIHPAIFSDELLGPLADALTDNGLPVGGKLLDPFAGLGWKLGQIAALASTANVVGIELEEIYFRLGKTAPWVQQGNSLRLPFMPDSFDGAVTSPDYPNGVSDNFHARVNERRNTYIHRIRLYEPDYELHPDNAGGMNPRRSPAALARFYELNSAVYVEVFRVLRPGAPFVVNTKDPLGVPFRMHTEEQLVAAGFELVDSTSVKCPGNGEGKNMELKMDVEDITVVRKP